MSLPAAQIQRRFLTLLGLRWLPVGFIAPILVLILTRDLSLSRAGILLAIYSITTAVLELPTGGLADAIGRRPVLIMASVAACGFFGLLLASPQFWVMALAMLVGGISRALDSGPLQSWFVDESKAADPSVDLKIGLSRAGAVDGTALAIGAVVGGILPELFDGRLLLSVAVALAFQVVHLSAVIALMTESRVDGRSVKSSLRTIPTTITSTVRLAANHRNVRRLFVGAASIGIAIVAVEALWQPRFIVLLGGDSGSGTAFLGVLLAMGFGSAALGSGLAPRFARLTRRWTSSPATAGQFLGAAGLALLAFSESVPLAAVAFVLFYAFNGLADPLIEELLHHQVGAERRSTTVSAESLVFQFAAFITALTLPALADLQGIPTAWLVGAAALGLGAFVYVGIEQE